MSGRSGLGQTRDRATLGPQPLRATVPYQLQQHNKQTVRPNPRRDGKSAGKAKSQQLSPGIRRTVSLDAILGPYLQGHWPKEPEGHCSLPRKDKSTQTPDSWSDKTQSRKNGNGHKRSASWGNAEHLREIAKLKQQLQQRTKCVVSGGHDKDCQHGSPPLGYSPGTTQTQTVTTLAPLYGLAPRLRRSVEGLNQELEGMFISQPSQHHRGLLDIPDGHRAPVPPQSCSSGSQSDPGTTPPSHVCSSSSSASSSPCFSPSFPSTNPSAASLPVDLDHELMEGPEMYLLSPLTTHNDVDTSLPMLLSSSPRPNKSYCFQREPPEGCEKVRVFEETSVPHQPKAAPISSCPDPNKVNFTPHGGSAFCPVSLLKPLLPSMDLLFRSLVVSPSSSSSGLVTVSYESTSSTGNLDPHPDSPITTAV